LHLPVLLFERALHFEISLTLSFHPLLFIVPNDAGVHGLYTKVSSSRVKWCKGADSFLGALGIMDEYDNANRTCQCRRERDL
jgi:hypothetical protein